MNRTSIKKTLKAFHTLEEAQTNYQLLFEVLSEEEEAEFERLLFKEGVTINKTKAIMEDSKRDLK